VRIREIAVGTTQYFVCWLLEAICICAVNVYVLITGYFMCDKEFKLSRVLKVWIKTLVVGVLIYIGMVCFSGAEFSIKDIVGNILPIVTNKYWFVTCYLVLLLVSPYLNIIINNTDNKKLFWLIAILLVFNVVFDFCGNSLLNSNRGMSAIWFINLYLIAAYIKKYKNNVGGKIYLGYYLACVIAIFISKYAILYLTNRVFGQAKYDALFYNYNSPLCIGAALSLFVFFKSLSFKWSSKISGIISTASGSTLMVYLLHENVYLRPIIFNNVFNSYLNFSLLKLIAAIFSIFLVSVLFNFGYEYLSNTVIKYGFTKIKKER